MHPKIVTICKRPFSYLHYPKPVYGRHEFPYTPNGTDAERMVPDEDRRRKTGRPLSVTLTPEAMILVKKYMNRDSSSPYLFPFLESREGTKEAYREYQLALRSFNQQLMLLGELLGLGDKLSSYTARHTWATTAYYCEIHPGIISEAMGHSSITVTETYLKPFRSKKIDEANKQVLDFIKRSVIGLNT